MEEAVNFLSKYSWIYNFKVTNLIVDNVLGEMPDIWLNFLQNLTIQEFNQIFIERISINKSIPKEITNFLNDLKIIEAKWEIKKRSKCQFPRTQRKGVSEKKIHEVMLMANFIKDKCMVGGIERVLDIGSGLGYLGEELVRQGLSVVGVEGSQEHSARADKRRGERKTFPTHVLQVGDNSADLLTEILEGWYSVEPGGGQGVMMVGLHCCGDLTPCLLQLFEGLEKVTMLAVVSCCYHKMENIGGEFSKFPISGKLKNILNCRGNTPEFSSHYMLRLGAQETIVRWLDMTEEDHLDHVKNVGFRAIFEDVMASEGIDLKKKQRRRVFKETFDNEDVESFVDRFTDKYELEEEVRLILNHKILSSYEKNKIDFPLFEFLTGLQFLLQSVIENLIHTDRVEYLEERQPDLLICEIVELFDEKLSPRNKVIFAHKSTK